MSGMRIAAAPPPREAFVKGVRAVALRRREGLGLARIAYEGDCDVTAEVVGTTLRVCAVTRSVGSPTPTPAGT